MKCLLKRMSYLWKKFLMEFNLYMQDNFVKELKSSFWDFVYKLFEGMILWNLCYRTDISTPIHYIMCIFMVQKPHNGLRHFSLMLLPFIQKLVLRLDCFE